MDQQEREEDIVSDMGCHFTWPELKRLDRMDLHRERLILLPEHLDFKKLPTRTLSITNLLGFLDYSLNEQDKGIQRFQDVLALDTCNVTAISCLMIIYKRLGLLTLYHKHAAKLQQVLCANNPVTLARAFVDRAIATKQFQQDDRRFTYMPYLVKVVSKGKHVVDNLEKAEWLFEYAHCLARRDEQNVLCNVSGAQMASVLRDAVQSFYNVIKLAEDDKLLVPKTWANLGNILLQKPNRHFKDIVPNERELYGTTAFDCFQNALKLSREDTDVLCIVGKGYMQMKKYKEALEILKTSLELRVTQVAHRQCGLIYMQMWKTKKMRTQNPQTSSLKIASVTCHDHCSKTENNTDCTSCTDSFALEGQNTDVCEDEEFSNDICEGMDSIRLDKDTQSSNDSNKIDYAGVLARPHSVHKDSNNVGADFRTSFYKEIRDEDYLLLKAKDSFTQATHQKATHADHSDLGHVLYLLGDIHQSIHHFSIAVKCQGGDRFDTSVTHGRWAKCLEMLKEMQGARIQRNLQRQVKANMKDRAPSVGESWRYTHGTNCQGFECDLSRFNYCKRERQGFINILSEFNKSPTNCNVGFFQAQCSSQFKYDFFVSFAHIDHMWAVSFVYKLEKDFPGLRGVLRYRDYELGVTIADNIANSVENSYRTLIILSPDSLRDQWCRYEISRGHMLHLNRPCVIPVMLRTCKMPREIEHLSVVRCDMGQIKTDDWDRLGRSLQQTDIIDGNEY